MFEKYTLRDLVKIKNGKNYSELKTQGKTPVYGTGGLMGFTNTDGLFNGKAILLPRKGSLTNIMYVNEEFWTVDTMYYAPITSSEVDAYYLYNFLKLLDLSRLDSGSGVPSMTFNAYYNIKISLPKLEIQKIISKIIFSLNDKIEVNKKINLELEQSAKLIFNYWFTQFDFPDDNGRPYKSSGGEFVYDKDLKRKIPIDWETKELKQIAKVIMGQSPKGSSYNDDNVGVPLINGPADYENGTLVGRTYTTEPTRLCVKNDLVFCVRATIGNLTYAEKEFCLGRGVAAIRVNDSKTSELVYYALLQEIERFKIQAGGSIIIGITKDDLTDSNILIPHQELLVKFHNTVRPIFDKIRINNSEILELTRLRDWLLPMLMTGIVTVK